MTPEQAREIDRLEFEADCQAARERAFAVITERHGAERARVLRWVEHQPAPYVFTYGRSNRPKPAPEVPEPTKSSPVSMRGVRTAHGMSMTLAKWAEHLGISLNTLHQRIHKKGSLEGAIAIGGPKPIGRAPGVVKNLPALSGTGGGSVAQDIA